LALPNNVTLLQPLPLLRSSKAPRRHTNRLNLRFGPRRKSPSPHPLVGTRQEKLTKNPLQVTARFWRPTWTAGHTLLRTDYLALFISHASHASPSAAPLSLGTARLLCVGDAHIGLPGLRMFCGRAAPLDFTPRYYLDSDLRSPSLRSGNSSSRRSAEEPYDEDGHIGSGLMLDATRH